MEQPFTIFPLGDSALIITYGNLIDEALNKKVLAVAHAINEAVIEGIKDIVPAYSSITIHYDVVAICKKHSGDRAFDVIRKQLETFLIEPKAVFKNVSRRVKIPVCYSPKFALDIDHISTQTKLPVEEIVALHKSRTYRVYMVGFLPGFAYMGEVDERIVVPRKLEPRQKIEEGCVGIAGKQTGIYPLTSPGGWQIIGRTPMKLFDKSKDEPVLFRVGDEVEFFSISEDEFDNY